MFERNTLAVHSPTELSDDLINRILRHLPTKSNFCFKCVSKEWFALNAEILEDRMLPLAMSGIFFNTAEVSDNVQVKYVVTQEVHKKPFFIDAELSFLPKHPHMVIYDSSNGLLLCEGMEFSNTSPFELFPYGISCLYVCNPTTTKWVKVKPRPINIRTERIRTSPRSVSPQLLRQNTAAAILDFNPLVSNHFDVIKIKVYFGRCILYNFEVFSSKSGKWSVNRVDNEMLDEYCFDRFTVSFFNGIIFAINHRNIDIVGVDREGKVCHKIDLPGRYHIENGIYSSLGKSGGSLHYANTSQDTLYVWKLVNYESGDWVLKCSFSVPGIKDTIENIKFHPDKDVIFFNVGSEVHSYDMQTTQIVQVCSKVLPVKYFPYSPCCW